MADYQANFMNALQGGLQFGQQIKQQRDQSAFNKLAQQAYGSQGQEREGALGQLAGIDAGKALELGSSLQTNDDARTKTLVNAAKLLTSAPEQQRPHLYQKMKPDLARLGLQMPEQYDDTVAQTAAAITQAYSGMDKASQVQSTYIDAQGNRVAILRDGSTQILGQNAPNNQIIDTGDGFYGVNKGKLQAAPVQVGGAPQQAPQVPPAGMYQTPQGVVRLGDDLTPEMRQVAMADAAGGGTGAPVELPPRDVAPQQYGGNQLRSAPKPASVPSGYRDDGAGGLAPIPGGPAQIAIDARADAAAARKVAEDIKTSAKRQEAEARQSASVEAANSLITSIDDLTSHPGFENLGTAWGDTMIGTPMIRNSAKDADAKLKNVAGQVALATLSRLKTLSASGATGFGSLTKPELDLVQNSIATLQSENISNAELKKSLKVIRDTMEKTTKWQPQAQDAPPSNAAGAGGEDFSNLWGGQ